MELSHMVKCVQMKLELKQASQAKEIGVSIPQSVDGKVKMVNCKGRHWGSFIIFMK